MLPGVVAAAIVSAYTYVLWSHPYAIIIFTIEAAFVGWRLRQRQQSLVIADCIYWLLIGIPLVWLFYAQLLNAPFASVLLILIKQAVNGIFNAVVATLLIVHTPIYRWFGRWSNAQVIPLQHTLLNLFVAFVFFPALLLTVLGSQDALRELEQEIPAQLELTSGYVATNLNTWHRQQQKTLAALAAAISTPNINSGAVRDQLKLGHEILLDSLRTYCLDANGNVLTAYPEPPTYLPTINAKIASGLTTQLATVPKLSDVLLQLFPIDKNDRALGFLVNEVSRQVLEQFAIGEPAFAAERLQVTILNEQQQILASSRAALYESPGFDHPQVESTRVLSGNIYHWLPTGGKMPLFARWRKSFYVQETQLSAVPWTILAEVPAAPYFDQLQLYYIQRLGLSLGIVVVAIAFAQVVSHWLVAPILHLAEVTTNLPDRLSDQERIRWPDTTVWEMQLLIRNFKSMASSLEQQFQAIQHTNQNLEQHTQELSQRTAEANEKAIALEKLLKELHRTQTQLIQAEKMSSLGQLVAGIAHEINNPVNFIYGNLFHIEGYANDLLGLIDLYQQSYPTALPEIQAEADAIELDFLREDLPNVMGSIKVGADRIRTIVLSLRNFSRLDETDCKAVDIHEGIDNTLLILQHRLKARPNRPAIEVIKHYGDVPLIPCYPGPLNQVFMNILANAIDALEERETHEQPGQITISSTLVEDEWLEVAIADNGPGIPDTIRSQIFNPFFTTKAVGKGTGMGMSISYQIVVEQHAGELTCRSELGEGTVFVIRIPR
ncbi:MAG: hypothetical protein F6J87_23350 [Spirulina sp. SIO3F2]|nr:hypothetical protein [Spirulina sp. SIO3F2]